MAGFKEYQMLFSLNARTESGFQSAFSAGSAEVAKLQGTLNQLNKTQSDINAYQKQQNAIDKTKSKIELYQTQLQNLQNATASTSKEEAELANAIAAKEKQLSDSEKTLSKQETQLNEMGDALRQAGVNTDNLATAQGMLTEKANAVKRAQMEEAESTKSLSDTMGGLSSILVTIGAQKALQTLYGGLKECSEIAAQFETSMASVKRTVGGDDNFINDLGDSFQLLSTQMPITASELAEIATTAGQLGIAQDNVEGFTTVMAQLATTTDLTADNAATMLAQFANITGTTEYDRLGATVAALGDSTATTASKVVEMSQGMAAAANIAGLSETDILAISAAVGSLGIESQAGSTAMTQLITTLHKATETGNDLDKFASVADMSAGQFASAWAGDPVKALDAFIQGLNDTERNGKSAMAVLDDLGITNVRQVKAILGLASAGDLLSDTIAQANSAWASNTALTEKAGIMYNTTEAKMAMLQNSAANVSIAIGDALNPALGDAAGLLTGLIQPIADFIAANPELVQGLTVAAGALGLVTAAVAAYEAKTKLAAVATKIFGTAVSGHFGAILAIAGGLGALVTTLGLLGRAGEDTGASFEELKAEYEELSDTIEKNQNIIDLVDQYKQLSKEVESIKELDPEDIELKAKIEKNGVTKENLQLIDDLKDRIANDTGELKQILTISGADDITQEDLDTIVSLAANVADGDHDLKQSLEIIGADNVTDENIERIKELSKSTKDGEHRLAQTLSLMGIDNITDEDLQRVKDLANNTVDGDHDLKQQLAILGAENVTDENIKRIKDLSRNTKDGEYQLAQTLSLMGADSVSDDDIQKIKNLASSSVSGDYALIQQLSLVGARDISDEDLAHLKELAASIETNTGTITENLELTGFEQYEDMKKAAELPISSKTADIIVNLKEEGYENVTEKLKDLGSQVISTQNELDAANGTLSDLQDKASKLQESLDSTKKKDKRKALEEELSGVNRQIEMQQDVVRTLESTHSDLVTQYEATAAAAQEVKEKEDALAATKERIAEATGGVIAGSEEETAALLEQAAAAAEAENALKRQQLYANLRQQAGKYAQAILDVTDAQAGYNEYLAMVTTSQQYSGKSVDEINQKYQGLLKTLDEMKSSDGFDPSNADYQSAIDQVEALRNIFTDYSEDLNQYGADIVSWVEAFSGVSATETHWNMMLEHMNASLVEYKENLDSAKGTQNDFLDEIADNVISGVVPIEEVEQRLMEAWKDEENQAELVAGVVDYVNGKLQAQAEEAEAAAAASDELAESGQAVSQAAVEQGAAIEDTIKKIDDLQKAYNEAYKAAYESMKGQFSLFDKAKDIKPSKKLGQELNDYKAALVSQKNYMKDYAENYEEVAKAVESVNPDVSKSFMAELADGSAESAQILANLAEAAPKDVESIVQAYADAEKAREDYAASMADAQTDFTNTMTALQQELEKTVQAMDFSDEAAANAKSALDAFVDQAAKYEDKVYKAYKKIADKAKLALKFNPSDIGYASGTTSAEPGVRLVGEAGPELVYFRGGETVLNAQKTQEVLNAEPVSASPVRSKGGASGDEEGRTYNINVTIPSIDAKGMDAGELMTALSKDLKDTIIETMEGYEADRRRRGYA